MDGGPVVAAIAGSHRRLVEHLRALTEDELLAPSRLPEWNRLTVVCHLRYGAEAIDRMVRAALADEPALFYPGGRLEQRPGTLLPSPGESPREVVDSFAERCERLDATLAAVPGDGWTVFAREPEGHHDLGPQQVFALAVLRLTEVDVHAVDLDVGIEDWSDAFCRVGLPLRLQRLGKHLANNPSPEPIVGTWLLRASPVDCYLVSKTADTATVRGALYEDIADGTIDASARDLIALMLGRPFEGVVEFSNDFARSFSAAFPGP